MNSRLKPGSYWLALRSAPRASRLALAALGVWAFISLFQILRNSLGPQGGNDLYTYWYAGLFVRQARDPYAAFVADEAPRLPIAFLDGEAILTSDVILPGLVPAPAITFPLVFLLSPLSFLTWSTAKAAWLVINLALVILLPACVARLLPPGDRLGLPALATLHLAFIGFTSTRYAASSGQLTFLVLALMCASVLLAGRRPWLAGILLGLALSKYSLALGFFLYYLFFERRLRLILAAILVQAAAVALVMSLGGTPILQVLDQYRIMFVHHARMEGIQLTTLLSLGGSHPAVSAVFTLVTGLPLAWGYMRNPAIRRPSSLVRLNLLNALLLWSLLVGYHRAYDALAFILFLGLAASLAAPGAPQHLVGRLRVAWIAFAVFSAMLFMLPAGNLARAWLPGTLGVQWTSLVAKATSLVLLAALALVLFTLLHWREKLVTGPEMRLG